MTTRRSGLLPQIILPEVIFEKFKGPSGTPSMGIKSCIPPRHWYGQALAIPPRHSINGHQKLHPPRHCYGQALAIPPWHSKGGAFILECRVRLKADDNVY